jgi:5-oxopent-3-ene-1,2,5-tricarboxylate decarboxylase / 2-hydroxyhepta-2,4-diene-1,7-dioate isomerase
MSQQSTWLPTGTVYGTLMNFPCEHAALAAHMHDKPYGAPPKAPVLFIKTANTFSPNGADIVIPAGVNTVQVKSSVFMVFEHDVSAKWSSNAINTVSIGLMNDVTIPHASFYRPPVKFNCIDGFLGIAAPRLASLGEVDALELTLRINGLVVQTIRYADMLRSAAQLVDEISTFTQLRAGDVLMPGCPFEPMLARAGDLVEISAPGCQTLVNRFVTQECCSPATSTESAT